MLGDIGTRKGGVQILLASDGCKVRAQAPLYFRRHQCRERFVVFPARALEFHLIRGSEARDPDSDDGEYIGVIERDAEPVRLARRTRQGELELSPRIMGDWFEIWPISERDLNDVISEHPMLALDGVPGCPC